MIVIVIVGRLPLLANFLRQKEQKPENWRNKEPT